MGHSHENRHFSLPNTERVNISNSTLDILMSRSVVLYCVGSKSHFLGKQKKPHRTFSLSFSSGWHCVYVCIKLEFLQCGTIAHFLIDWNDVRMGDHKKALIIL